MIEETLSAARKVKSKDAETGAAVGPMAGLLRAVALILTKVSLRTACPATFVKISAIRQRCPAGQAAVPLKRL
jgi:hypothetical protein